MATPADIDKSDVVVLAIYFDVMKTFIPQYSEKLVGKIVVDRPSVTGSNGVYLTS